jgi:outer membrane protein OmpA-like peptidoglycan-associated protein
MSFQRNIKTLLTVILLSAYLSGFSQADTTAVNTTKTDRVINDVGSYGKKLISKIKELFALRHKVPDDYTDMELIELLTQEEFDILVNSSGENTQLALKLLYPRITPSKGFFSFQLGDYEYYKYIKDLKIDQIEYIKLIDEHGSECYVDKFNFIKKEGQKRHFSFLLDHSGSMGKRRANDLQLAIYNAIENNIIKDKTSTYNLYKFSEDNALIAQGSNLNDIRKALIPTNGLDGFGGGTAVKDILIQAITDLKKQDRDDFKLIVLFTDGDSNSDLTQIPMQDIVKEATENNINIVSVAFGSYLDIAYLQDIAQYSGGNLYHIYKPEEFEILFNNIFEDVLVSYDLEFAPCMFGNEITLEMKLTSDTDPLIGRTVFRTPLTEGYSIDLNVLFDSNSSRIDDLYFEKLNALTNLLKFNTTLEILVEGHSDRTGSEDKNLTLSRSRAAAIKNYLVSQGIDKNRITTKGFGSSKPAFEYAPGSNEEPFNRRIQIVITKQ